MSLDDLFDGSNKTRRDNKKEREAAVSVTGRGGRLAGLSRRHQKLLDPEPNSPFAGGKGGRLTRNSGAAGSSLDSLGSASPVPRARASSADRDFSNALAWGRFTGR